MTTRIQLRRDTAAAWATANPVLSDGEPGLIEDTGELKVGDGVTPWTSLPTLFVGGGVNRKTFQPFTFFRAGDYIVQGGTTVSAITNFTTGASYVSTDWEDFAVALPNKINVSEKGAASGVAPLNASSKIDSMYLPTGTAVVQNLPYTMADGDAAVGNGRWSPPTPTAVTLASFRMAAETGPDGRAINADLQALGSGTIATASIPTGSGPQKSSLVTPSTTSFPSGSQFRVAVTQVGVQPSSVTPSIAGRTTESTTTGLTKDVAVWGSAQVGDIVTVSIRAGQTDPDSIPSGFTLIHKFGQSGGSFWIRRYQKVYAGETGPWTWDFTSSGSQGFSNTSAVYVRGADQTAPIDAASGMFYGASTSAQTPAALTTTKANDLVLYYWTTSGIVSSTTGVPTGYTAYTGFTSTGTAHLGYLVQASPATLSTPTVTPSASFSGVISRVAYASQPAPSVWTPGQNLTAMIGYSV